MNLTLSKVKVIGNHREYLVKQKLNAGKYITKY